MIVAPPLYHNILDESTNLCYDVLESLLQQQAPEPPGFPEQEGYTLRNHLELTTTRLFAIDVARAIAREAAEIEHITAEPKQVWKSLDLRTRRAGSHIVANIEAEIDNLPSHLSLELVIAPDGNVTFTAEATWPGTPVRKTKWSGQAFQSFKGEIYVVGILVSND